MGDHDASTTGLQPEVPAPTAISGGTAASAPPVEHEPEHEAPRRFTRLTKWLFWMKP